VTCFQTSSHPVIVTSTTTDEVFARGVLVWDAAFSEPVWIWFLWVFIDTLVSMVQCNTFCRVWKVWCTIISYIIRLATYNNGWSSWKITPKTPICCVYIHTAVPIYRNCLLVSSSHWIIVCCSLRAGFQNIKYNIKGYIHESSPIQ